jgi:hydrogenase maturation protease
MQRDAVAIAGLGNLLLTDDGIGVWLIRALQKLKLPDSLTLFEVGTSIFTLQTLAAEYRSLLLVDAVHGGYKPGSIYYLSADEIRTLQHKHGGTALIHSLHDFHIPDILTLTGTAPVYVSVFGVEPETIDFGIGLSPLLADLLPSLAEQLKIEAEMMADRFATGSHPPP